ncbi:MAG: bifunctional folylpolyglutamate synthase/dihydrofolate synthase [Pedosphaera sp.]|nr:bifunctional folylpolyglutamate synthase/dihydrofolate synthase [Pedosphaera sp.]
MTYSYAIEFLYSLRHFGAKFGLENTQKLAALAGNPHEHLRFIHVAGTNGKGSTCAMLESVYRASGLRVGLFTSPHLVAFGERIQINRENISEADVVRLVGELRGLIEHAKNSPSAQDSFQPTFFEFITVMALRYFAEQRCELVIWETGLGGRLDATNIVTPLASVITNIQLDHQQWLGDTIEKIAFEKAGIIKPGVPVVTGEDSPEALEVIRETAQRLHAPVTMVTSEALSNPPLDSIRLPLPGEHQRRNAALALATVRVVGKQIPVQETAIREGLETVQWAARFQIIRRPDGRMIILDAAHNPAGVAALLETLRQAFPDARPTLIFGAMRDKDWREMCLRLAPAVSRVIVTAARSERATPPQVVCDAFASFKIDIPVAVSKRLSEAFALVATDSFVLVTGSLHFVGEAMELMKVLPAPTAEERGLNEWTAPAGKNLD